SDVCSSDLTADDTESIAQVLRRRLARLDEDDAPDGSEGAPTKRRFAYRPGLLIVDGGQPQVQAAAAVLAELGIDDIPLVGIAKRLEEVWLPDDPFPVILPRGSAALCLLQRIRALPTRFATTFQRQMRRADFGPVLSEPRALGPARWKELLRHYGSVARPRAARVDELPTVRGIVPQLEATI